MLKRETVVAALNEAVMNYGDAYTEGLLAAVEIVEKLPAAPEREPLKGEPSEEKCGAILITTRPWECELPKGHDGACSWASKLGSNARLATDLAAAERGPVAPPPEEG